MRCRFCNKSISLLRRLNDAEFCSAAHREAYAGEQEQALERLVTSPLAMQRTQRLAAAKPGHMGQTGELLPFLFPTVARPKALPPAAEPLPRSAAIQLVVRENRFMAGLPAVRRMFLLPSEPAAAARTKSSAVEPAYTIVLTLPRRDAVARGAWTRHRGIQMRLRPIEPAKIPAKCITPAALANPGNWQAPPRKVRSHRGFTPGDDLLPVSSRPCRRSREHSVAALPLEPATAGMICIPLSRLALMSGPGDAEAQAKIEEQWDAFAAQAPECLLPATAYTAVTPASLPFQLPSEPQEMEFPGQLRRVRREAVPMAARRLAGGTTLIPLADSTSATTSYRALRDPKPSASAAAVLKAGRRVSARACSLDEGQELLTPPEPVVAAPKGGALWSLRPEASLTGPRIPSVRHEAKRAESDLAGCVTIAAPAAAGGSVTPLWSYSDPLPANDNQKQPPARGGRATLRSQGFLSHAAKAPCLAISPPGPQAHARKPVVAGAVEASLRPLLTGTRAAGRRSEPRERPVRLFSITRLMEGVPSRREHRFTLEMAKWRSRVAIPPLAVAFDDGTPRRKTQSVGRFGQEIRARLSPQTLERAWLNISRLPSDLKWISMVVPLILGIWVLARPSTAESLPPAPARHEEAAAETPNAIPENKAVAMTPVAIPLAPAAAAPAKGEEAPPATANAWETMKTRVTERAAVNFTEDFRNGLSQWAGSGEWARTWSYDRSGTVRPGQFAIFQPSADMRDYVLEMKASVERRAIQWAVRASDPRNYHFSRLLVTPGASQTKLEFERWSVVNGRAGRVTRLPLPHGGANQTLYDLRVEVKGDSITTYLQGQVIDTMNDSRLPQGGIGLIGASDDRPRIYGIHVYHQNDFFGKLCSFLAPRPINGQGSD